MSKKLSIMWVSEDAKVEMKKMAADERKSMVSLFDDMVFGGKKKGRGGFW